MQNAVLAHQAENLRAERSERKHIGNAQCAKKEELGDLEAMRPDGLTECQRRQVIAEVAVAGNPRIDRVGGRAE